MFWLTDYYFIRCQFIMIMDRFSIFIAMFFTWKLYKQYFATRYKFILTDVQICVWGVTDKWTVNFSKIMITCGMRYCIKWNLQILLYANGTKKCHKLSILTTRTIAIIFNVIYYLWVRSNFYFFWNNSRLELNSTKN